MLNINSLSKNLESCQSYHSYIVKQRAYSTYKLVSANLERELQIESRKINFNVLTMLKEAICKHESFYTYIPFKINRLAIILDLPMEPQNLDFYEASDRVKTAIYEYEVMKRRCEDDSTYQYYKIAKKMVKSQIPEYKTEFAFPRDITSILSKMNPKLEDRILYKFEEWFIRAPTISSKSHHLIKQ